MNYFIVGVDPGTTTAVALLDLKGSIVDVHSSRDFGLDKVIRHITGYGLPALLASDVSPVPGLLLRLSSSLRVNCFTPGESLPVSEKIELTKWQETGNAHERDALAAALNAFNKNKNKLRKIESLGLGDEVKAMVLNGQSIQSAVESLRDNEVSEEEKPPPVDIKPVVLSDEEKRVRSLEKQNRSLRREIESREEEIDQLERKILELTRKSMLKPKAVSPAGQSKTVKDLKYKISKLEKDLDKLMDCWGLMLSNDILPVGVYPQAFKGLTLLNKTVTGEDEFEGVEVVFTSKKKNFELLLERNCRVFDDKHVEGEGSIRYIRKSVLDELVGSQDFSIEDLVNDYRTKRNSRQ